MAPRRALTSNVQGGLGTYLRPLSKGCSSETLWTFPGKGILSPKEKESWRGCWEEARGVRLLLSAGGEGQAEMSKGVLKEAGWGGWGGWRWTPFQGRAGVSEASAPAPAPGGVA